MSDDPERPERDPDEPVPVAERARSPWLPRRAEPAPTSEAGSSWLPTGRSRPGAGQSTEERSAPGAFALDEEHVEATVPAPTPAPVDEARRAADGDASIRGTTAPDGRRPSRWLPTRSSRSRSSDSPPTVVTPDDGGRAPAVDRDVDRRPGGDATDGTPYPAGPAPVRVGDVEPPEPDSASPSAGSDVPDNPWVATGLDPRRPGALR